MKKLFLVLAISSLGMGAAMAQNEVPSYSTQWTPRQAEVPQQKNRVPAGSPDAPSRGHVLPFNGDYGTLANPG